MFLYLQLLLLLLDLSTSIPVLSSPTSTTSTFLPVASDLSTLTHSMTTRAKADIFKPKVYSTKYSLSASLQAKRLIVPTCVSQARNLHLGETLLLKSIMLYS